MTHLLRSNSILKKLKIFCRALLYCAPLFRYTQMSSFTNIKMSSHEPVKISITVRVFQEEAPNEKAFRKNQSFSFFSHPCTPLKPGAVGVVPLRGHCGCDRGPSTSEGGSSRARQVAFRSIEHADDFGHRKAGPPFSRRPQLPREHAAPVKLPWLA